MPLCSLLLKLFLVCFIGLAFGGFVFLFKMTANDDESIFLKTAFRFESEQKSPIASSSIDDRALKNKKFIYIDHKNFSTVLQNVQNFLRSKFQRLFAFEPEPEEKGKKKKVILLWTTYFGSSFLNIIIRDMRNCVDDCILTDNRSLLANADAVIFHLRDTNIDDLPKFRQSHQRFVFYLQESPLHSGAAVNLLPEKFFNWTMTCRRDSDIVIPCGKFERLNEQSTTDDDENRFSWEEVENITAQKSRLVAQYVSNCHTDSTREQYVKELSKLISVDVFGACSNRTCGTVDVCNAALTSDYFFYLAFENSVCRDYVTEKFWRLKLLTVPVVLRAKDYREIAPNGSYIAADQFESPMKLAAYLFALASNRTAYLEYFNWTKHYKKTYFGGASGNCQLCQMLRNDSYPKKVYDDIKFWWGNDAKCENGYSLNLLLAALNYG